MNNTNSEFETNFEHHPLYQTEAEISALEQTVGEELSQLNNDLSELWTVRTRLFTPIESYETGEVNSEGKPIIATRPALQPGDGLYHEDPAYNSHILTAQLGVRAGGTREYNDLAETYGEKADDTQEVRARNYEYRQFILGLAKKYGFVTQEAGVSGDETDRFYTIKESQLEPIEEPVESIIILGAAGKSNVARARGAVRDILSGTVQTNKIILAGCDRPTRDAENDSVQKFGTSAGANEVASMMIALQDDIAQDSRCLLIDDFKEEPELHEVPYGKDLVAKTWQAKVLIGGKEIEVTAVSAPYDPERVEREKGLARANTDETIYASLAFLPEPGATNVIVSHDAWGPVQADTARMILGLEGGKKTILSNVFYDDRVIATEHGEDIRAAEQVVDELQKLHRQKTKLLMAIKTRKQHLETGTE